MIIGLVDADIVAYRCASSCSPTKEKTFQEPEHLAIQRADELLHRIGSTINADELRLILSGSENFRKAFHPSYKANRVQPKPEHLDAVRNFLVEEWQATVCAGYEADDGLGITAAKDTVICSIDKDLRQIPGWHYDFVKNELFEVDLETAIFNFYSQMLIGDRSDNVIGVPGIGPVKSRGLLTGLAPDEMEAVVLGEYRSAYGGDAEYLCNANLLYVLRDIDQWTEIETLLRESERPAFTAARSWKDIRDISGVN
jgi:5'-3' exonuclease